VELLSLLQLLRLDGRFSSASCNKISIQASVFGSGVLSSLILSLFVFMVRYYLSIAMTAPALPAFCNSLFSEGGIDKVQSCLALTTHTRQHMRRCVITCPPLLNPPQLPTKTIVATPPPTTATTTTVIVR
jgi:hypothetical protein